VAFVALCYLMHSVSYANYPGYICNIVRSVDCCRPRRGLRSSSTSDFSVLTAAVTHQARLLGHRGPPSWNALPAAQILQSSGNITKCTFQRSF